MLRLFQNTQPLSFLEVQSGGWTRKEPIAPFPTHQLRCKVSILQDCLLPSQPQWDREKARASVMGTRPRPCPLVQALQDPRFPPETPVSGHPSAYMDHTEDMSSLQSLTLTVFPSPHSCLLAVLERLASGSPCGSTDRQRTQFHSKIYQLIS